jgi:RNA 3'-phosphate cyclase
MTITIDGSHGEGGGQMIRTSIALSAITGIPVNIKNIRAKRCNPGLSAQHLKAILACTEMCNAEVTGAELGSSEVEFIPKKIHGGKFSINIGTAGSTALILQTLIPVAIHAPDPVKFQISGGTNVKWSMDFEYMQHIFGHYMKSIGIDYHIQIEKRGFYPKGGGKILVKIKPGTPTSLQLTKRGKFQRIDVRAISESRLESKDVCARELKGFSTILKPNHEFVEYHNADSIGTSMHAHAHYENCKLGSSVIGDIKISAEQLGKKCATQLKKQIDSGACIDEWMADQILPYMAFTGSGKIHVAHITQHTETNIHVIEKFLPIKFNIDKENNIISVKKL